MGRISMLSGPSSLTRSYFGDHTSAKSTFFTWIRLAYPEFRDLLGERIRELTIQMTTYDTELVQNIEKGVMHASKNNPFRPKFIRLLNLQTLMEFCIPDTRLWGCYQGKRLCYPREMSVLLCLFL